MERALCRWWQLVRPYLIELQSPTAMVLVGSRIPLWARLTHRLLRLLMLLLLVALALALLACSRQDEVEKPHDQPPQVTRMVPSGGTYRRPLPNDPASLDPVQITDYYAVAVANQIFDGLIEFDAHLNVLPGLAQSWSASRDGLVWTFNLRQGATFHNGREVVAEDVVYSLSRLLDPAVGSRRGMLLEKVKGATEFQEGTAKKLEGLKAVNRYSVQITLSEPYAPFINIFGLPHTAVIPREEVERLGADFATTPVGTGPFRLVGWERGREIVLEVNQHYFRGRPSLDLVRFVIFPGNDEQGMVQAFERGELEESPIPLNGYEQILQKNKYIFIRKPTLSLLLLGFNIARPPFDTLKIRQAFNYAINKDRINRDIRMDRFIVARGILPPGMPGYNPEVRGYTYNPDKAKELLAKAGYRDGIGLLPVTLVSNIKSTVVRQEHQAVQQDEAAVGIQVDLREIDDWPSFQQALQLGEPQIFRLARFVDFPDPDNFLYPLFHSQSRTNYFQYRNPTVDRLLDDARRETDDLRRVKLYREAEQVILDDAPAVMLLHYTYERLFQPYVEGIEVNALGDPYIPIWKIHLKPGGQTNARK
jgi:oligopeptide transport system substrate-binding protein